MTVNISEFEKENGELYMVHGNLNITMVYLRLSYIMLLYTVKFLQNRRRKKYERIKEELKVLSV